MQVSPPAPPGPDCLAPGAPCAAEAKTETKTDACSNSTAPQVIDPTESHIRLQLLTVPNPVSHLPWTSCPVGQVRLLTLTRGAG